jgi:hypothetical protein
MDLIISRVNSNVWPEVISLEGIELEKDGNSMLLDSVRKIVVFNRIGNSVNEEIDEEGIWEVSLGKGPFSIVFSNDIVVPLEGGITVELGAIVFSSSFVTIEGGTVLSISCPSVEGRISFVSVEFSRIFSSVEDGINAGIEVDSPFVILSEVIVVFS